MRPAEIGTLASGLALTLFGTLLLLNEEGTIEVTGGWLIACLTALAGVALVASGIAARDR